MATKTAPAAKTKQTERVERALSQPVVHLDQYTKRSDADVLPFGFCRIESGEHAGLIGTLESTVTTDAEGYPETVVVKLRNQGNQVVVDYADLTPVAFGGR